MIFAFIHETKRPKNLPLSNCISESLQEQPTAIYGLYKTKTTQHKLKLGIPYISNSKTVLEDTLSQKLAVVTLPGLMILLGIQSHKLIVSQIWIDARKNWL